MSTAFVVGATGVLGTALIPRLVAAGYHVRALSRSPERDAAVRALGAEPVRADLFDPASLRAAMAGADAAFHLATRIPPTARASKRQAWVDNDRVRAEGTRNVVDAALAADVRTVIYPGYVLVYPDGGDRWLDAASTPAQPADILRSSLAAEAEIARFAAAPGRRGIALRLGSLYGPGLASAADLLALARRGIAPLFGRNGAYLPTLWIDDAASALLAALGRVPSGVYDVVDDEPLTQGELRQALAAAVGRRRLPRPPVPLARRLLGAVAEPFLRSQRVSNRRFRAAAGWSPSVPSARVGMARLADPPARDDRPGRRRALLGVGALAIFFLAAGAWQQFAPRSFYDAFPGFGMYWVSVDGPYNEHLLRDLGGANLALGAVAVAVLLRPSAFMARALATAALGAQALHTVYHLAHLSLLPTTLDQTLQTASLLILLAVAALVLAGAGALDPTARPAAADSGATGESPAAAPTPAPLVRSQSGVGRAAR